jgi:type IV pilus assembly protein PilW
VNQYPISKGFSLLETLIGMLLASALLILLSNSNFNLSQSNNIKSASIQMEQSANIILNYLQRNIANAGAYLDENNPNIIRGADSVDSKNNDDLTHAHRYRHVLNDIPTKNNKYNMLDCAGTGRNNTVVRFEKILLNGNQLRCDANGGNRPTPQPMLDNVRSLQFLYGVDTNDDNSINQYLNASKIADWKMVKSVQAGILLHSTKQVFTKNQNRTHKILDHTFSTNDRYLYRKFILNVSLRNRLAKIIKTP